MKDEKSHQNLLIWKLFIKTPVFTPEPFYIGQNQELVLCVNTLTYVRSITAC
jgi:hypothetical protein